MKKTNREKQKPVHVCFKSPHCSRKTLHELINIARLQYLHMFSALTNWFRKTIFSANYTVQTIWLLKRKRVSEYYLKKKAKFTMQRYTYFTKYSQNDCFSYTNYLWAYSICFTYTHFKISTDNTSRIYYVHVVCYTLDPCCILLYVNIDQHETYHAIASLYQITTCGYLNEVITLMFYSSWKLITMWLQNGNCLMIFSS